MKNPSPERKFLVDYWTKNKLQLHRHKSIKEVYKIYKEAAELEGVAAINEYKFREYIRKNGYCNSCSYEVECKKCIKAALKLEREQAEQAGREERDLEAQMNKLQLVDDIV